MSDNGESKKALECFLADWEQVRGAITMSDRDGRTYLEEII